MTDLSVVLREMKDKSCKIEAAFVANSDEKFYICRLLGDGQ